jgi:hypothetical protein
LEEGKQLSSQSLSEKIKKNKLRNFSDLDIKVSILVRCPYSRTVLGERKGVLIREVSSFQGCSKREGFHCIRRLTCPCHGNNVLSAQNEWHAFSLYRCR